MEEAAVEDVAMEEPNAEEPMAGGKRKSRRGRTKKQCGGRKSRKGRKGRSRRH
jgi:hypothetical protein